jgi:hypothetical protein
MSTINPRISVPFEEASLALFAQLADQEHKSIPSIIRELTLEALERREDLYLSKLAEKLDTKKTKKYTHEEAWK